MDIQTDLQADLDATGLFEARYIAFLETISHLRPRLHRYCARMTGSVLDGEDVMQEAVFEAYRKLDQFDDSRVLSPWLFRIATIAASISCAGAMSGKRPRPPLRSQNWFCPSSPRVGRSTVPSSAS
jgi:hypothetical protein